LDQFSPGFRATPEATSSTPPSSQASLHRPFSNTSYSSNRTCYTTD
jgi:hypothetical protein